MHKRTRNRALTKKVTSINFYVDQATQIQALMEATGSAKEAPLVRQLVDEALAARRRKSIQGEQVDQPPPTQESTEILQTIQTLLLRLIGQGETTYRIQSANLELLQETLVEARAGRVGLWETLAVSTLAEKGRSAEQIASLFEAQTEEAKDYAYRLAEEIRNEIIPTETAVASPAVFEEDRQGRLKYDHGEASDDGFENVA